MRAHLPPATPDAAPPAPRLAWPAAADERVVTLTSFVLIGRPAAAVFEFASTAALWDSWHPATERVAAPLRPLTVGDRAVESIRVGRRRFSATWTVLACEAPALWVIAASPPEGDARIAYELRADGPQLTRFFRTLDYRSRRWPWTLLDANVTRAMLARQSERALERLKRVLEGRRAAP